MAFKSKLFQKLAEAAGINLFNHNEKIADEEYPLKIVDSKMHFMELLAMNTKYFSIIQGQRHCIRVQRDLINSFDAEVEKWDAIQATHEKELYTAKVGPYKAEINRLTQEVNNLKHSIRMIEKEKNKVLISAHDVDRLIKRLDEIHYHHLGQSKEHKRLTMTYNILHSLLQKLQAHSKEEKSVQQ